MPVVVSQAVTQTEFSREWNHRGYGGMDLDESIVGIEVPRTLTRVLADLGLTEVDLGAHHLDEAGHELYVTNNLGMFGPGQLVVQDNLDLAALGRFAVLMQIKDRLE